MRFPFLVSHARKRRDGPLSLKVDFACARLSAIFRRHELRMSIDCNPHG